MQPDLWQQLTLQSSKEHQLSEFSKKYCGSYMLYSDDDYPSGIVAYVKNDPSEESVHAIYNPVTGHLPLYYSGTSQEVSPFFPEPGAFTHEGRYFVGKRIPERQYLKSVSDQSYFPQEVLKTLLLPHGHNGFNAIDPREGAYSMLEDSLDKPFHSFEFRHSMPEGWSGFALNKEWGLTLHPLHNDWFILWHNANAVAEVIDNQIRLVNTVMRQEVLDLVRDSNINGVVM